MSGIEPCRKVHILGFFGGFEVRNSSKFIFSGLLRGLAHFQLNYQCSKFRLFWGSLSKFIIIRSTALSKNRSLGCPKFGLMVSSASSKFEILGFTPTLIWNSNQDFHLTCNKHHCKKWHISYPNTTGTLEMVTQPEPDFCYPTSTSLTWIFI